MISSSSSSSSLTFIAGLLVLLFLWALLASDATTTTTTAASSNHDDLTRIEENSSNDGSIMIIEDFAHPQHPWGVMNDPVMGGQSTSSITIANGTAQFRGTCAIVPFLKAPGFITMVTGGYRQPTQQFPNIETCQAFRLVLQSHTDYAGFYMSFGTVQLPEKRHARGYKTHLEIPQSSENTDDDNSDGFDEMIIPFGNFSSNWDEGTGQIEVSCQDDARYCPTPKALQDLQTISFWGEGIQGDVALDIRSIAAVQCASSNDDDDDDASSPKNNNSTDDDTSLPNNNNNNNNTDAANDNDGNNSNNPSSSQDKTTIEGRNADSRNHHHTLFWLVAMGGVLYWTRDSWKGYLPHTTASSTGGNRYDAVPEIQLA